MNKNIFECKRALVSVSDKAGLVDFLKPLVKSGLEVVSTGGTAKHLQENGIDVIDVQMQTGFPEVMDGRVKTLHPKIHMSLLYRDHVEADLDILKDYNLQPFDMVVGNLYPFEEASEKNLSERQLSEFIDIGGPSFLRAAAKSFERMIVVCQQADYQTLLEKKNISLGDRKLLAAKVFSHTASYDSMIAIKLGADLATPQFGLGGEFVQQLRYGENPTQMASWYRQKGVAEGIHKAEFIQGKPLSYNNLLDLDAAIQTLREFDESACVSVKHLNPCGVAIADKIEQAVELSIKADPVSVFGGIVAINKFVNQKSAEILTEGFLECVVAPDFSDEALEVFKKKTNLRVLKWPELMKKDTHLQVRTISGGFLLQTQDRVESWSDEWKVIGEEPSPAIKRDLSFAWRVCAHLKSNAIAISGGGQTLGLGMGQVNRVDAVEQAIDRQIKHHPDKTHKVLASDAFFPFADSIELAHRAGIHWVIQPGGSMRDEQVIAKAQELGVNLVLTGQRHFQH